MPQAGPRPSASTGQRPRRLRILHDRYGITFVGAIIPSTSTQAQVSAGELSRLARTVEKRDVQAIFPESALNPRLATHDRRPHRREGRWSAVLGHARADRVGRRHLPGERARQRPDARRRLHGRTRTRIEPRERGVRRPPRRATRPHASCSDGVRPRTGAAALRDVDFTAYAGQRVAVLGPNGGGRRRCSACSSATSLRGAAASRSTAAPWSHRPSARDWTFPSVRSMSPSWARSHACRGGGAPEPPSETGHVRRSRPSGSGTAPRTRSGTCPADSGSAS